MRKEHVHETNHVSLYTDNPEILNPKSINEAPACLFFGLDRYLRFKHNICRNERGQICSRASSTYSVKFSTISIEFASNNEYSAFMNDENFTE